MFRKLLVGDVVRRNLETTVKSRVGRQVLGLIAMTLLVAGVLPSVAVQASAERPYVFTTVDFPGASATFAMGNNARGDVVGYYSLDGKVHGFLFSEGTFTSIDFPGDDIASTQANAIGPAGDIVGVYYLKSPAPAGNVHGFLLTSTGEWLTVDYPDPEGAHLMAGGPFAILPDGTLVGCVHDGAPISAMYGYIMGAKGMSRFDYPESAPFAMHYGATPDGKTIVGTYRQGGTTPGHWHGYMLDNGNVISFDVPDEVGTQALGINQAREVVGIYRVQVGAAWYAHGYLAETHGSVDPADWTFTEVDFPGASQTIVRGINAGGDLVGYYYDASGVVHGFIASAGSPVH